MNKKIAIIGAGHMGISIFRGLIKFGELPSCQFILSNPNLGKLKDLQKEFGIPITRNNIEAVKDSDIIFIAVKPMIVAEVMREIKNFIRRNQIIISVAASISFRLLEKYIGINKYKIVRIMPNLPVMDGRGIIGWLVNKNINDNEKISIQKLLSSLGLLVECKDDDELDKLSMISGCGPGYVGYFMKCLQSKAVQYGFSERDAYRIVLSTFSGTLNLFYRHSRVYPVREGGNPEIIGLESPINSLIQSIATKGGFTEEVLKNLDRNKFPQIFGKCIDRGYDKIKNIEKVLEELK